MTKENIIKLISSSDYLMKISAFKMALQDLHVGKIASAQARIRSELDKVLLEEQQIALREFINRVML